MADKILRTEEEHGNAIVNLKSGKKIPVKIMTLYTHYESGRKDCNIIVEDALPISGEQNKLQ